MKLVKWTIAPVAAASVFAASALPAFAAEGDPIIQTYGSNGSVSFIAGKGPTDPLDPNKPDPVIPVMPIDPTDPDGPEPGTDGPLSIDFASSLDFGVNNINGQKNGLSEDVYYAKAQELDRADDV